MVGGEWVAWVVIPLAAQLAEGNLFALLDREPPPVWRLIGRWSTVARPLGRLPRSTDIAAITVRGEYAAGQAGALRALHALGKLGRLR
jgi:hypothetical protein